MRKSLLLASAIALIAAAAPSQAANLLANGSFEDASIGAGNYSYPAGTYASWTYSGSALVNAAGYNAWYGSTPPVGQDGTQFAALQSVSTLSQTFTASASGATLTWLSAGRPQIDNYGGFENYAVQISTLGGTVIGSGNFSTTSGTSFAANSFSVGGLNAGTDYVLTFVGLGAQPGQVPDETAFIDNVSLTGAVPEPASWAMMLGGFGLVGGALRSRRARLAAA